MFSEKIKEIKSDRSSGASQISRNALVILKLFAQTSKTSNNKIFVKQFTEIGQQLLEARTNMSPVQNLVAQIVYAVNSLKDYEIGFVRNFAISKIDELCRQSESAVKESAIYAADLLADFDCVSTCSYSSTICETIKLAKNQGKIFKVFVAESRSPDDQFRYGKDLATFLESINVPVQVFPDNKLSDYVPNSNCVMVGADSILSDGSIINGTPTCEMAVNAKESGVPFYSICETAKVNTLSYLGNKVEVKQGFEIVPFSLLTGLITENGILSTKNIIELMKEKARYFEVFSFQDRL
ncbi:MAG: hypothetical protein NUK63_09120 [Candidatus Bathyarchaeum tardum]|nr:MAG: hypothetical protein NUK63_09120 [Candidatus Bathyarchaeum tardum]